MSSNPVADAIFKATNDVRVRQAMLLGSNLESSFNLTAAGDQGTSFGPFQIHLPAHPGVTKAQAEDATFAVGYMLPAYAAAATAQGQLWGTNGELAAEQTAVAAERPARNYFASQGQKTVDAKWAQVQQIMTGNFPTDTGSTSTQLGGAIGDNPLTAIGNSISGIATTLSNVGDALDTVLTFVTTKLFLPKTWARVLAFDAGVTLILIGLWLFFSQPGAAARAASSAGTAASTAAGAALLVAK